MTADSSPGNSHSHKQLLDYTNLWLAERYAGAALDVLRGQVTQLPPDTRMVALTSDDDHNDWHNDDSSGHEVYVLDTAGDCKYLTIGEDGQCDGSSNWLKRSVRKRP